MTKIPSDNSRRKFIKSSMTGMAALAIVPSSVLPGFGKTAPSDKLNIAAIGVGGVGYRNLLHLEKENIVALCDVDGDYGRKSFRRWSTAERYTDFRVMLENEKGIDGVVIATPDHTHAVAAMAAMQLQKHVYVQSPMAHAIFEVRRMNETARVFNVVSQVGNQSASGDEVREICEIIWAGTIGEIEEVHAWTSHPLWKQGLKTPEKSERVPKDLDWNLFLGPSEKIDYHSTYTPYGWRAWWQFGNGALGSMGPHVLEPVYRALRLNVPTEVEASSTEVNLKSAPHAQKIVFHFDRRDNLPRLAMPALKLHWYDGGLLPDRPGDIPAGYALGDTKGGVIFKGSKGSLICGAEGLNYSVFIGGEKVEVDQKEKQIFRITDPFNGGHEGDWVRACKESSSNRLAASASFEKQAGMAESILLGSLAVRMQSLQKKLKWDKAQMRIENINLSEEFEITRQGEMYIQNGIPKFETQSERFNASHFVDQLVRPIYREGWQQI